jgi:hypothetical protein
MAVNGFSCYTDDYGRQYYPFDGLDIRKWGGDRRKRKEGTKMDENRGEEGGEGERKGIKQGREGRREKKRTTLHIWKCGRVLYIV